MSITLPILRPLLGPLARGVTEGGGSFGPELVTNGGFDVDASWTKGALVTISGGVANLAAGSGYLEQSIATVAGATYRVWAVNTGNACFCGAWDTAGQAGALSGSPTGRSGSFSFTFVANDSQSFLGFAAGGGGAGTVDNVSARRIG
jgi:hypothetical protein